MAVGDVVADLILVTSGQVVDIRPPSGNEWIVHNIVYGSGSSVNFNKVNSSGNVLTFDTDSSMGGTLNGGFHCNNNIWYQIKNTGSTSIFISYDGVQTK